MNQPTIPDSPRFRSGTYDAVLLHGCGAKTLSPDSRIGARDWFLCGDGWLRPICELKAERGSRWAEDCANAARAACWDKAQELSDAWWESKHEDESLHDGCIEADKHAAAWAAWGEEGGG